MPGPARRRLTRNVWAASATSFLMDVSTEMVVNVLPLFLSQGLGARTAVIGLIEGVAESTASLTRVFSGVLSDRWRRRKAPAVAGYALSALAKPGLALATGWPGIAAARWADRVGKGVRTAPRDALVAASVGPARRGLAFGLHRAADTGGAVVGLLVAIAVIAAVTGEGSTAAATGAQGAPAGTGGPDAAVVGPEMFRTLVWVSCVPALLAVAVLARFAVETPAAPSASRPRLSLRGLGRPFGALLAVSALFDLGNSSDAFLVLRAHERGLDTIGILWTLVGFNAVYAAVSTPAGSLSDRVGRRRVLAAGWLLYAAVYAGLAKAPDAASIVALYALYGVSYGLTAGTARALVGDLVPDARRGAAYGVFAATMGLLDLPASLIAGVLWQGLGAWPGLGPGAPFAFGAVTALAATAALLAFVPDPEPEAPAS